MSNLHTYNTKKTGRAVLIVEVIFWALMALIYFWVLPSVSGLKLQREQLWWGLVICTLLSFLFYAGIVLRRKALERFGDSRSVSHMVPELSTAKQILKFFLWRFGLAFIVFGLINPRYGKKLAEVKYQGIDLMICLDVSNSMLAEDLKPNRLRKAKRAISQLLGDLHGDRIGLIVFGGDAYVQLPITTDYAAANMFLSSVDNTMVPVQGTAIGAAINLAVESFDDEQIDKKSIIIISDGENHEDDAITAAEQAIKEGCTVHTIGMGSEEGAPLPIYVNRVKQGFKKDKEGNTVISKLNEVMLRQVAEAGDGIFVRATNAETGLNVLLDEIEAMGDNDYGTEEYADYEDRFQVFLIIGILLLVVEFLIPEKKSRWANRIDIFEAT